MALPPQPETLRRLNHRWSRLIEIWVAYTTFLHREVEVGPDKVCLNDGVVTQTTHTMLIVYYSYVYSLFDSKGTDFGHTTSSIVNQLPEPAIQVREKILEIWGELEAPLQAIRHNVGFHAASADKGHRFGLGQLENFHPLLPQALCAYLRVFFRMLDEVYAGGQPLSPADRPDVLSLLEYAKGLEVDARRPMVELPEDKLLRLGITMEAYESLRRTIVEQSGGKLDD